MCVSVCVCVCVSVCVCVCVCVRERERERERERRGEESEECLTCWGVENYHSSYPKVNICTYYHIL